MKRLAVFAFLLVSAASAQVFHEIHQYPIDAYVMSFSNTPPAVPGVDWNITGKVFGVNVSLRDADSETTAYRLYLRVAFEDGTVRVFRDLLERAESGPTFRVYLTGERVPVKVQALWIQRLHAQPNDNLISPGN
jgi:hypothetical protein